MSAQELPPPDLFSEPSEGAIPINQLALRSLLAVTVALVPVVLFLPVTWAGIVAALLVGAGVMRLARAANGGVGFTVEVWATFACAVLGWFPPLIASIIWAVPRGSLGLAWLIGFAVAFAATAKPVFLAVRRFVMWHRHPKLLTIEAVGESWRRGTDGKD